MVEGEGERERGGGGGGGGKYVYGIENSEAWTKYWNKNLAYLIITLKRLSKIF